MNGSGASSQSYDALLCEVKIDGKTQYMICARVDGPAPLESMRGVTEDQIEGLFRRVQLRATPLPQPGNKVKRSATMGNSMHDIDIDGGG